LGKYEGLEFGNWGQARISLMKTIRRVGGSKWGLELRIKKFKKRINLTNNPQSWGFKVGFGPWDYEVNCASSCSKPPAELGVKGGIWLKIERRIAHQPEPGGTSHHKCVVNKVFSRFLTLSGLVVVRKRSVLLVVF
jgi:hypothetical protein